MDSGTVDFSFLRKRNMDESQVFMDNLKGSAAANVITGVFIIVFWVLKNKCKHCECRSHTRCFTCSVKEDDDVETGQRRPERQETIKIPGKAKIRLREVHQSKHASVLPQYSQVVPTD